MCWYKITINIYNRTIRITCEIPDRHPPNLVTIGYTISTTIISSDKHHRCSLVTTRGCTGEAVYGNNLFWKITFVRYGFGKVICEVQKECWQPTIPLAGCCVWVAVRRYFCRKVKCAIRRKVFIGALGRGDFPGYYAPRGEKFNSLEITTTTLWRVYNFTTTYFCFVSALHEHENKSTNGHTTKVRHLTKIISKCHKILRLEPDN